MHNTPESSFVDRLPWRRLGAPRALTAGLVLLLVVMVAGARRPAEKARGRGVATAHQVVLAARGVAADLK